MTITSAATAPLVVVVGSTGVQGGSVIRNLIESDKPYRLRGLTRDASKPAAQKLRELGVDVVSVTIGVGNEPAVRDAFRGADVVFSVTNFWEHMDHAREVAEGKLMVDAAKAVDVKLFVFSGLPPVAKLSGGKYTNVVHFDAKAAVVDYARSQLPTVDVQAGYYMTNVTTGFLHAPKKLSDGTYRWDVTYDPNVSLPFIDTDNDYGLFVRYAIESPEYNRGGGTIYAYGEQVSVAAAVATLERVRGLKVNIVVLPHDVFMASPEIQSLPPVAQSVMKDLSFVADYGYSFKQEFSPEQQKVRAALPRQPRTFEEFLKAHPEFFTA